MEEDVQPKDEDGVDGRGVCGWDGWVCGLGVVGASLAFGYGYFGWKGLRGFGVIWWIWRGWCGGDPCL